MWNENKQSDLPPSTPTPPVPPNPIPPIELKTIWDVVKIVVFVVVWYVTSDANHALTAAVDYSKVAGASHSLIGVSWNGALIGLLQGAIMSVQALAVIWASPTLFTYLGPVLTAALQTPIRLVAEFRRALGSKNKGDDGKDGDDKDKNDPKKS